MGSKGYRPWRMSRRQSLLVGPGVKPRLKTLAAVARRTLSRFPFARWALGVASRIPRIARLIADALEPPLTTPESYRRWVARNDTLSEDDRAAIQAHIRRMAWRPVFSPVPADQLYPVQAGVDAEFFVWTDPGTVLTPTALYEAAAALNAHPETDILFGDQDDIDAEGQRSHPYFRPGWSPELFREWDYIGSLVFIRRSLTPPAGGLTREDVRRLAASVAEDRVRHIPAILCHRRQDAPSAMARPMARLLARPSGPPLVSVIVPTRDRAALLRVCMEGVLHRTDYPRLEVIIADNGSTEADAMGLLAELARDPRVRVARFEGPFNYSALNNQAVRLARGEILLFLNNDIEMIGDQWLYEMVSQAVRPVIGAVGARLLYRDGRVQHAGIALGVGGGVAGHLHLKAAGDSDGYFGDLRHARDVSAVTAACMALRRSVFDAVGGFDADHLAVAFNDVDLCLKIRASGLRIVWTPRAELYHLESASRGSDTRPEVIARFRREIATMQERWRDELMNDPYFGPHFDLMGHHYQLAPVSRRVKPWRAG